MLDQGMNRRLNKVRNVVDNQQLHTGRHLGAQLLDLTSYVIRDADGVRAGLAQDLDTDNVLSGISLAEQSGPGAKLLGSIFHLRYVANPDRYAAMRSDDDLVELVGGHNAT